MVFLVNSDEEWLPASNKIGEASDGEHVRKTIGLNGRETIERKFHFQSRGPRWNDAINIIGGDSLG